MSNPSNTNPPQDPTGRAVMMRFHKLREELHDLANKLTAIEMDFNEHKMAIETLDEQDPDRKCFRKFGEYLIEATVKEVNPVLKENKDKLENVMKMLLQSIAQKNKEIDEYRDKYNIITQMQQEKAKQDGDNKTDIETLQNTFAGNFRVHFD